MVFIKRCKIKGHIYLYVVSNYRENGKIKQKFHGYLGREGKLSSVLEEFIRLKQLIKYDVENLSYQAPLSLWNLTQELEIPKIFSSHFKKKWGVDASLASTIMILNYALESRSKNKLSKWYEQTYLKYLAKIKPEKLNSDLLYRTLDFFSEKKIEKLHAEIFQKAKEKYNLGENNTMYDVTALFLEGEKCPLAKRGYNSEALYKLQVNLGLAVTNEKFPVTHKTFEGNIKDVTTFDKMLNLIKKTIDL